MTFITGPLWSGKRDFACRLLGCTREELSARAVWDVQELAAGCPGQAGLRLACLLAERAGCVVRVFCGLPLVLKGECKL